MDTPGLFDTESSHEKVGVVIVQAFINMHPGPDIFLYVIKLGSRFTKEESGAYNRFKMLFGKKVIDHLIILFTGLDEIEEKGQTISQVLEKAPPDLQEVFNDCQRRIVVFNNKRKAIKGSVNPDVGQLLQTALGLKHKNGGKPFKPKNFCKIGETIEENVGKKLREIEDQEAQFMRYTQEVEADLRDKLEELDLSKEEHDKQMAGLKTKLAAKHKRMVNDWNRKKEEEVEQMRAEKETHAKRMRYEREQEEQAKINRQNQEERERQRRQQVQTEEQNKLKAAFLQNMQAQKLQQQREAEQLKQFAEMKIQAQQQLLQQQQKAMAEQQQRLQQEHAEKQQRDQQEKAEREQRFQQEQAEKQQRLQQEQAEKQKRNQAAQRGRGIRVLRNPFGNGGVFGNGGGMLRNNGVFGNAGAGMLLNNDGFGNAGGMLRNDCLFGNDYDSDSSRRRRQRRNRRRRSRRYSSSSSCSTSSSSSD